MSETTNYKLYVSDDDSERFIDWRKKLNGENDSNMHKIDEALSECEQESNKVTEIDETVTDEQYASAKAVKKYFEEEMSWDTF